MPIDEKLTEIFVSIRSGLVRAVGGIVPPKDVEDVVQETYVRVCQAKGVGDIRSPRSFMYKTARNIALNHINRAEFRLADSLDIAESSAESVSLDAAADTLKQACTDEEFSFFCDAVRSLPVKCRRSFVLKKVYGHTYGEIAEIMGISEKTVEKHISKGIVRCRSYMIQRTGEPSTGASSIRRSGGRA